MKILMVDDAEIMRKIVKDFLESRKDHYEVSTAEDGEEALAIMKKTSPPFDLVITDTEMPRMGGIELTEWVKTNFPKIPVILTSGAEEPKNHQADIFLAKPFNLHRLEEILKSLCLKAR